MKRLGTFIFLSCFFFWQKTNAQISVTATAGTTGPTTYTNFTNAFNAINAGTHTGSITVTVTAGFTQSGSTIPTLNASGSGAASYTDVTIKPAAGTNPIITNSGDNTAAIKLNGADNVTIDGSNNGTASRNLTFVNSNTNGSGKACNIWLASNGTDGATNNVIRNCKLLGSSGSGAAYVGVCVYSSQATLTLYNGAASYTTGANSNNLIQNNLLNSANAAVVFNGGAGIGETGNQVIGNEIGDPTSSTSRKFTNVGIFMVNQANFTVSGNTFTWQNATNRNVAPGSISIGDGCTNGSITRNNIKTVRFAIGTDTTLAGGILLNAGLNANINVYNNFITDLASKGTTTAAYNAYGIAIGKGSGYNIAFNSVNMNTNPTTTASGYQAALYIAAGVSGLNIQNNLFIHSGSNTTNKFSIYSVDANLGSSTINYNDYYTAAATLAYANGNQNALADVHANFQNGSNNSKNVLPVFTSSTDLHLVAANGYNTSNLAGAGTPIAGVATDYDNNARNAAPTIGAHEIAAVTCNAPYSPSVSNITATTADLDWSQSGTPVNYEIKYGAQGFDVSTAGASVFTTTKPYTLNPPLTQSTNYSYYVRAICASGDTSAWSAVTNFATPVSCFAPTSATATNITATTADLNWNYSGSPLTYEVKYGPQGFNVATAGTSVFTATKPYTLNPPLTPNTNYSYYVRAVCAAGDTSAWAVVTNFTTPVSCFAPTAPASTGITKNSAVLNWTNTGSPVNFEIKYGPQGFNVNTAGTSVFTAAKPYVLNPPLMPSTAYNYYVRSICTPGDTSAWSVVNNFTTLCDYPVILSTTNGAACQESTATLQATAEAGGTLKWYANTTGGSVLGTGNSFVTPALNTTDTFYAEAVSQPLSLGSAGRGSMANNAYVVTNSYGQGLIFNALANIVIDSVGIWINTDAGGNVRVGLANSNNVITDSITFTIPAIPGTSATNPAKIYLPVAFNVPMANGYKLIAMPGGTNIQLGRENTVNPPYPYANSAISITSSFTTPMPPTAMAFNTNTANYYYFYDVFVSASCTNPYRQPVIATVTPNPLNNLPDTTGTCNSTAATLNSNSTNTTWAPANVLYTDAAATTAYAGGALQTVYAKVTTPTTVYASTTSGSCTFEDSVFVDMQTGTAVTITAATPAMNCGDATPVSLTANTPVVWSMNGGNLYTDAGGTAAYAGTSVTNVYASANNNRNVIGAYEIGGCTFADTVMITVNNPATSVTIANNSGAGNTDSSMVAGTAANLHNADCELMATVTPTGGAPLNGMLNGRIIMDGAVQNTATGPYVTRHFELTPLNNGASATASITLYFTQSEFDAYNNYVTNNGNSAVNPLLPSGPGGSTAHILVDKFNAASGSPGPVNNNSAVVITPTSVTWDATHNWWAVTFPTTGFSGFFLHTNVNATPLPVTWNTVTASLNRQKQGVIEWSVAERETVQYHIEKSFDGTKFTTVGTVKSKGNGINNYTFTEPAVLNGKAWYRIAQAGSNNEVNYSQVMMLQNSAIYGQINIYPNPATKALNIESVQSDVPYGIYDLQGRERMKGLLKSGKNQLDLSGFAKGFYTIRIGDTTHKIVIQ